MNSPKRFKVFLKGILMGIADTVPGVSGGTIAFITGIYERLINGINSVDVRMPYYLLTGRFERFKKAFFDVDFEFFIPLGTGIIAAFLVFSRAMVYFLEMFPATTFGFFFGLILASSVMVFRKVSEHSFSGTGFALLGFATGFVITGLETLGSIHTLPMLFFAGFTAVFALILPGISGSFILLILGQYEYIMTAVHSFSDYFGQLIVFLLGGILSLFSFSKLLSYLFEQYENYTLLFLTGLMVGSLRMPLSEVISEVVNINGYLLPVAAGFLGVFGVFAVSSGEE